MFFEVSRYKLHLSYNCDAHLKTQPGFLDVPRCVLVRDGCGGMMFFRKIFLVFFKLLEKLALVFLSIMVLIVFANVVMRNVFNYGLPWGDEVATLMMVWFGFLGIAIGVLERVHMSIELFTMKFPPRVIDSIIRAGYALVAFFGILMVRYGVQIMSVTSNSTMPATQWPSHVLYIVLPLSGALVAVNGLLVVCNLDKKILGMLTKTGGNRG
jgi:TRAP-type C4-dicarboxylate transport system permease small subunit